MTTLSLEKIKATVEATKDWAIDVLDRWVRCPSTLGNERTAQLYIEKVFKEMNLDVRREAVSEESICKLPGYSPSLEDYQDRPNIVGEYRPFEDSGRSLIINGHVDVVSAEPEALWSSPPFQPKIFTDEQGESWMQGRGAGDMKGGTVACMWAFEALRRQGYFPNGPITFQSCIEEECTGNGTLSLLSNGARAEACVIPEPFDHTVLAAQAGVLWFDIEILGKTTHVLGAGQGVNAIEKGWHVFSHLKTHLEAPANLEAALPDDYKSMAHPINLNLGVIKGGDWPSTVAGDCTLRCRMGMLPGTDCKAMMAKVAEVVDAACTDDPWLKANPPKIVFKGFQADPCRFDASGDFGQTLMASHKEIFGTDPNLLRATCTTDVRFFNLYYDIPATCYGPRAIAIHGADERLSLDSMQQVAMVMTRLITTWCGITQRS